MKRSGSITVLFLLMLIAVIAVGAMAVDLALVEAARTDMRITADLASRAATVEYIETESVDAAIDRAQELAAINKVAGANLTLGDADIVPGNSARQSNDKYVFSAGGTPINSFRVNARLENGSSSGSLNTLFSKVHNRSTVELAQSATATETYLDVVLVLDRSGSMAFDHTGVAWSYPTGGPWYINYYLPPKNNSRWDSLENAISVFLTEMDLKEKKEHVALVTYSSSVTYWSSHFSQYFSATEVSVDEDFTQTYSNVMNAVLDIGSEPVIGGTAISSGIDEAVDLLNNSPRNAYSEKVIILLTDGVWNTGYDPSTAAAAAANDDIVIHTVSFGSGAGQTEMQEVADATGGTAYDAPGDDELEDAFREIARSIGISLTE